MTGARQMLKQVLGVQVTRNQGRPRPKDQGQARVRPERHLGAKFKEALHFKAHPAVGQE